MITVFLTFRPKNVGFYLPTTKYIFYKHCMTIRMVLCGIRKTTQSHIFYKKKRSDTQMGMFTISRLLRIHLKESLFFALRMSISKARKYRIQFQLRTHKLDQTVMSELTHILTSVIVISSTIEFFSSKLDATI